GAYGAGSEADSSGDARPGARATGISGDVVGIVRTTADGTSVQAFGGAYAGELRQIDLPQDDGACGAQPFHDFGVFGWQVCLEGIRAGGRWHAYRIDVVLEKNGHSVQRTQRLAFLAALVGCSGLLQRIGCDED